MSGTVASTADATTSAPSSVAGSPGASSQPPAVRLKAIVQLDDPVNPAECSSPGASQRPVGAGTTVTLSDQDGAVLGTGVLREPQVGEAFGPQGYTFDGWGDLEELNGEAVTHACFYVAEFGRIPPASLYVVSMDGAPGVDIDQTQLDANDGWILQII